MYTIKEEQKKIGGGYKKFFSFFQSVDRVLSLCLSLLFKEGIVEAGARAGAEDYASPSPSLSFVS